MNNGYKDNDFLLARIFTSSVILPVLFALLTSALSSVVFSQDPQDPQEPPVVYENLTQYLLANEEYIPGGDVAHWDNADYWSQHIIPTETCDSYLLLETASIYAPTMALTIVYRLLVQATRQNLIIFMSGMESI